MIVANSIKWTALLGLGMMASIASAQSPELPQLPGAGAPALPVPEAPPRSALSSAFSPGAQREPSLSGNSITNIEGSVKCLHDIKLAAQSDGILQELLVDEGAAVEKGQLVLTIDERTALAELAVAQKEFEAADAQAKQDANLRFSKKVADVSDAEYNEVLELYKRTSASKQETRRKLLEAEKARLGIEVAEVDHSKDILAAAVAKEKVQAAQVQLTLRKVNSPYEGIIVERYRDQGEWVKAGEPILRLVHMKEMRIEALVPVKNSDAARLHNAAMTIRIPIGGKEWTHTTRIEFVSPVVEMARCRIWAKVPNTVGGNAWLLRDGMQALVDINLAPSE